MTARERPTRWPAAHLKFVKRTSSEDTGGGTINDKLELANGEFLVIAWDSITLYRNEFEYEEGYEPIGTILR